MVKKQNKLTKFLKDRTHDITDIAIGTGIFGFFDYLGDWSITHPLNCVAIGAGFFGGFARNNNETSQLVTSLIVGGLSMSPDVFQLATSGDFNTFAKSAGIKVVGYGVGALISTFISCNAGDKYDGLLDVNVEYENETDANNAFKFMSTLVNVGDYIQNSRSNISEPEKSGDKYLVNAKIIGRTSEMENYLRPSLEKHFVDASKSHIGDVVKITDD